MTKTNIRKRAISILLILMVMLTMTPMTASAAEPEWTIVNTFDELKEAMQRGTKTNIKLGKDINTNDEENHRYGLTSYDKILVGNTITLDLNGKKLTLNSGQNNVGSYINVTLGNLTVQDSASGGEIFLNDEYEGGSTLILLLDTATFTLKSGTIRATTKPETSGIDLIQSYGTVNIEGGTLTCTQTNGEIGRLHSDPNHWTSCYALKCFARDNVQTTITGGAFTGFVKIPVKNNGKQNKITNVTFDGSVVLDLADEKNMTWSKPGLTVENAEVKGTLFINGVCYHEKSTDIAIVIGDGWYATLDVNDTNVWVYDYDLFKETYEAGGNDVSKATFKQGYAPYQLKGGTYRFMNFGSKAEHDIGYRYTQEAFRHILGNGAIKVGNYDDDGYKIYTYSNIGESFKYGDYMVVMNSSWKRIPFIPNAWGMKSVTLDGKEIDYFKDWKGTAENLTNDKAHTLKFEWNPLAQELKDAGYSYRAECDRYISGNNTPTTDTISATDTEYSFTIPAGADPKVYSFALHLNLKNGDKNVGIFSNEHIVKLVVSEAPVVEPDPTIEGSVYYTNSIVFGRSISTAASGIPAEATKAYQWQRSMNGGSTWTNIDGATRGSYTPVAADMGKNVRIRVVVTAEGYLGEIVGAALKVSKAANDNTPAPPAVAAQTDDSGAYKKFVISDFNSNQEYVYTTSAPTSGNEWPTGGTKIDSSTVTDLTEGNTYYIFTRYKETATHTAGSKISSSSVLLDDVTKLNRIILTDESGKEYSSYGNGNTIYIKKGTSVTLNVTKNPVDANKWSAFTFKSQYDFAAPFTVTAPAAPVASGAEILSVTIHGDKAGTGTLAAQYSGYSPQFYGTWRVHVYENIRDIGTGAEITVSPTFADATMHPGETMTLPAYTVTANPEGALADYHYEWYVREPATSAGSMGSGNNVKENTYFKVNDDGTITAKAVHTGSEDSQYKMVLLCAVKGEYDKTKLASFNVTVTEAPTIELTGLTVAPKKVNLDLNATYQLSAVKEPVNAAGNPAWESNNPSVATVDSTGKVTAKAQGTAIIKVTCGGMEDTCTVTVDHQHGYTGQPYLYLDPGNHYQECKDNDGALNIEAHDFNAWTKVDADKHSRTCSKCKKSGETANYTEIAEHTWVWVVDQEAALNQPGKQHEECTGCHDKRSENTEIPALKDYAVAVTGGEASDATGTITRAMEGVEVTVTAQAPAGTHFVKWIVKAGGVTLANETSATTNFTMPANDVTIEASFEKNASSGGYVPTVQKPEITIIGSGKADLSADGRTATITAAAGHELVSVVLNGKEMGKVEKLTGLKTGDKATITFQAKADGKTEMDKMIAQKASKLKLMARSAKTAKKNIKVVVKGDLKAITDADYTVKYKFYRSTKKSAGYKAMLTKKAPTYFNTYGKQGTMYYYKARVMIYDKDGKFVAQTALKQCKYANRLWTK